MLSLYSLGQEIAARRRLLKLTQTELAHAARISRATLDALENSRGTEIGVTKLNRILIALGLELHLREQRHSRPTLEELEQEQIG